MSPQKTNATFSAGQITVLALLRVAIGWHFLYEGVSKWMTPGWSSASYLASSRWVLKDAFHWILAHPAALRVVDLLNMAGLTLIGLCLFLGLLSRVSSLAGMLLLASYYASYPPLPNFDFGSVHEGTYLLVDKNLVEFFALFVLAVIPTGKTAGLDRLLARRRARRALRRQTAAPVKAAAAPLVTPAMEAAASDRRAVIKSLATAPFLLAFGAALVRKQQLESHEEKNLVDAVSRATIKSFNFTSLKELRGTMPMAPIRGVPFSRVILGGNLIGGWAHARDLIYVSKLVKAYHHRDKVFETFLLAEQCGINAILTNPVLCDVINAYWKRGIGKIKFISDCGGDDVLERVQVSIDKGAAACYVQGQTADRLINDGEVDVIGKALDLIRKNGLPAGIGGHHIKTVQACVDHGLQPDFWMKTLHPKNYWSARHTEECDNVFCFEPEETISYMQDRKEPWIAFKTLAAGAIDPKDGFQYAFENGADFLCVGMYDFQLVDNTNLALSILNGEVKRARPWMA